MNHVTPEQMAAAEAASKRDSDDDVMCVEDPGVWVPPEPLCEELRAPPRVSHQPAAVADVLDNWSSRDDNLRFVRNGGGASASGAGAAVPTVLFPGSISQDTPSSLVVVHMPDSADCVCRTCVTANEAMEFLQENAQAFLDEESDSSVNPHNQAATAAGVCACSGTCFCQPVADSGASIHCHNATTSIQTSNQGVAYHYYGRLSTESTDFINNHLVLATNLSGHMRRSGFLHSSATMLPTGGVGPATVLGGGPGAGGTQHLSEMAAAAGFEDIYQDAELNPFRTVSPMVYSALQEPLSHINAADLHFGHDFASLSANGAGWKVNVRKPFTMLFSPFGLDKDKRISPFNINRAQEFVWNQGLGNFQYNHAFWTGITKLSQSMGPNGTPRHFSTLELAAAMPQWTVPPEKWDSHKEAMVACDKIGPGVGGQQGKVQAMFLSLKGDYTVVFQKTMKSPMVRAARNNSWVPLFLLKNFTIAQRGDYGVNGGHQATTMNLVPKSYLILVGFYKGKGDDLQFITLTNSGNQFMSLSV